MGLKTGIWASVLGFEWGAGWTERRSSTPLGPQPKKQQKLEKKKIKKKTGKEVERKIRI